MFFICALKKYFDAQRIDAAGYSAVRTQKAIIILFMLSVFFSVNLFFLSSIGLYVFIPLLFIFPMYWLILSIGFKGAYRRSPKLLFTFFLSKAFFELALLSSLAFLFLFIGVATIVAADEDSSVNSNNVEPVQAESARQYANPSGTYAQNSGSSDDAVSSSESSSEEPIGVDGTDEMSGSAEVNANVGIIVLSVFSYAGLLCIAGLIHFVTTLVTLILTMRTFVLLKKAQLLPLAKKAKSAKKAAKRKSRKAKAQKKVQTSPVPAPTVVPSTYAPETIQMYSGAQYQPMVYVIPMPQQE